MGQPARQLEPVEATQEPPYVAALRRFHEAMEDDTDSWEAYMTEIEAENGGPIILPKELEEQLVSLGL